LFQALRMEDKFSTCLACMWALSLKTLREAFVASTDCANHKKQSGRALNPYLHYSLRDTRTTKPLHLPLRNEKVPGGHEVVTCSSSECMKTAGSFMATRVSSPSTHHCQDLISDFRTSSAPPPTESKNHDLPRQSHVISRSAI
jgi:hypothetical protein